jgi:hypothetical protein
MVLVTKQIGFTNIVDFGPQVLRRSLGVTFRCLGMSDDTDMVQVSLFRSCWPIVGNHLSVFGCLNPLLFFAG